MCVITSPYSIYDMNFEEFWQVTRLDIVELVWNGPQAC